MKILILVATESEFEPYKTLLPGYRLFKAPNFTYLKSKACGNKITVVQMGMGKVAASIAATYFLSKRKYDFVVNAGLAGSPYQNCKPGTTFTCTVFIEHDLNLTPLGIPALSEITPSGTVMELCEIDNQSTIGPTKLLTGDKFMTHFTKKQMATGFSVCDMEGVAVVRSIQAIAPDTKFLVLKMVSDNGSVKDYNANLELCGRLAKGVLFSIPTLPSMVYRV